jgi:hypothetical protein
MKSIKSSLPELSPAGLRGSILSRNLDTGLSTPRVPCCFVDNLRPSEDVDAFADFEPLPLTLMNGCGGLSWPGEGPVDLMKSAKSRIDSCSTRGSLASCLPTTFLLGDDLVGAATGPLLREDDLLGRLLVPNELSLSAFTRGWTTILDLDVEGRWGSTLR